jgi:hypothetical protein
VVAAPPPQQGEFGTSPLTEARQNPATNRDGVQRHPTRETLLRPCHTLRVIRQLFGDLKIYISRGKRGLRGGLLKRHRMNASPRVDTAKDTVVVGVVLLGGKADGRRSESIICVLHPNEDLYRRHTRSGT